MNKNNSNNGLKKLALSIGTIAAGWAVKKVLETGYKKAFDEAPPNTPGAESNISPQKLFAWTIVSGIVVSATKTLIKHKAGDSMGIEES
jgi:hypothetical protein